MPFPRSLLRSALIACLLAAAHAAPAQQRPGVVSFQRVAMPDQVPAHLSTVMAQDAQGLLWIGTQDGLVRYDGYGYKVFRPHSGDPSALGGSYIRALHPAHDGRLWVGTISGGLSVFDPRTERFTQYRHDPLRKNSLANDRVESIAEMAGGLLWLATDNGLSLFDPASNQFTHYRHVDGDNTSLANDQLRAVLLDREGRLWVASDAGVQRWLGNGRFSAPVGPANATRLFQDSRGRIWIGSSRPGRPEPLLDLQYRRTAAGRNLARHLRPRHRRGRCRQPGRGRPPAIRQHQRCQHRQRPHRRLAGGPLGPGLGRHLGRRHCPP
jgi:ligand-binding sensor domain-containing protein